MLQEGDTLVEPCGFPGPAAVISGTEEIEARDFAGSLIIKYALEKAGPQRTLRASRGGVSTDFEVDGPASEAAIEETRVC